MSPLCPLCPHPHCPVLPSHKAATLCPGHRGPCPAESRTESRAVGGARESGFTEGEGRGRRSRHGEVPSRQPGASCLGVMRTWVSSCWLFWKIPLWQQAVPLPLCPSPWSPAPRVAIARPELPARGPAAYLPCVPPWPRVPQPPVPRHDIIYQTWQKYRIDR